MILRGSTFSIHTTPEKLMAYKIKRSNYAEIYGPTVGDRVRLGDTSLILQVEKDHTVYGG